jgi:hypothetical protein
MSKTDLGAVAAAEEGTAESTVDSSPSTATETR